MKSTTCKGSNNQYLEEYHTESAARIDADFVRRSFSEGVTDQKEFNRNVEPYRCRTCNYWHVQTVNTTRQCMFCMDSALFLKDIYATKAAAEEAAKRVGAKNRIRLFPYKCPHGSGWHLSKRVS